jgi:DNA repair protein RadC
MVAKEMKLSYIDTGITLPIKGQVKSSADLYRILKSVFIMDEVGYREHFYALYFSSSNTFLGYKHVSSGGISGTVADIRIIMQGAILANATLIAICHNHPSGNLTPSVSDIEITQGLSHACKLMDMRLIDHLIISDSSFYSFSDDGRIRKE